MLAIFTEHTLPSPVSAASFGPLAFATTTTNTPAAVDCSVDSIVDRPLLDDRYQAAERPVATLFTLPAGRPPTSDALSTDLIMTNPNVDLDLEFACLHVSLHTASVATSIARGAISDSLTPIVSTTADGVPCLGSQIRLNDTPAADSDDGTSFWSAYC